MKCIYCGCMDSKVIDSRVNEDGTSIRRRRECMNCGKRFTTYETIETAPIMVIKKSGCRQIFSPQKLKNGIVKACDKRPLIGDLVMEGLKDIDDVAYVRFAAVHRQFKDINSWLSEINEIVKHKHDNDKK